MDHICIRIYACGEAKYSVRDDAGLKSWLEYNLEARPGNTLFVDGVRAGETGYLSGDELEAVSAFVLSQELPAPKPRRLSKQWDDIERRHFERYPDDDSLVSYQQGMEFLEQYREGMARATSMTGLGR